MDLFSTNDALFPHPKICNSQLTYSGSRLLSIQRKRDLPEGESRHGLSGVSATVLATKQPGNWKLLRRSGNRVTSMENLGNQALQWRTRETENSTLRDSGKPETLRVSPRNSHSGCDRGRMRETRAQARRSFRMPRSSGLWSGSRTRPSKNRKRGR